MSHPEIRDAFSDEISKFAEQLLDISKFVDLREYSIKGGVWQFFDDFIYRLFK